MTLTSRNPLEDEGEDVSLVLDPAVYLLVSAGDVGGRVVVHI